MLERAASFAARAEGKKIEVSENTYPTSNTTILISVANCMDIFKSYNLAINYKTLFSKFTCVHTTLHFNSPTFRCCQVGCPEYDICVN